MQVCSEFPEQLVLKRPPVEARLDALNPKANDATNHSAKKQEKDFVHGNRYAPRAWVLGGRSESSNENKISDGYREQAPIEVEVF
jgi:hypothetical protein